MTEAKHVIEKLQLIKSPTEGGYYREVFKENRTYGESGSRVLVNDIYYLLTGGEICALHRVKVPTEIYSFYAGDPVEMIQIDAAGKLSTLILGADLNKDQIPKAVVPVGVWQGLRLIDGGHWSLMGIACVPGFEPGDYEGGSRSEIASKFPQHADVIGRFTE